MKNLQDKYQQMRKKEFEQFKPCKGSQKIAKSLFKNEKEYSKPAHERLHNKVRKQIGKIDS